MKSSLLYHSSGCIRKIPFCRHVLFYRSAHYLLRHANLHRSVHPLICLLVKILSGIGEIIMVVHWLVEWVTGTQWPLWRPRTYCTTCCLSNTRRCLSAGGHNAVIGLWIPLILYGGVDNLTILCINLISDIMCFNIQKAIVLTTWNIIMSRFVFSVLQDVVLSF